MKALWYPFYLRLMLICIGALELITSNGSEEDPGPSSHCCRSFFMPFSCLPSFVWKQVMRSFDL